MKIIYNNLIPFKGFKAINLFGMLFVRKGMTMNVEDTNHEEIHTAQMKELLYVLFYLTYFAEWIGRMAIAFVCRRPLSEAYYRICFEREAYTHQADDGYLERRRRWGMWK